MTELNLSSDGKRIAVPYDSNVAQIANGQRMQYNGHDLLVMDYDEKVFSLLSAMQCEVQTPFELRYQWPKGFTPFQSQIVTSSMLTINRRVYVNNDMGTGKTAATSAAMDWLMTQGSVERALIVAPLSTLSVVWGRELFTICPHRKVAILHGSATKRKELLDDHSYDVYVINHDGLRIISSMLPYRPDINLIVVDELAEYRNARTQKYKTLKEVVNRAYRRVWGLTGTPIPNAPTDAWGQIRLLTPERTTKYFGKFRDLTMIRVSDTRWAAKPEALDVVRDHMQPSVRFKRSDCVDIPPVTYSTRSVELLPTARRAYQSMKRHFVYEAAEGMITAANEGVKLNKLLQISCGMVYTDDGSTQYIDPGNRIAVVEELIGECNEKVLIFIPYTHALLFVANHLHKKNYSVECIYGETPARKRSEIITSFQSTKHPRIIVAHPHTMAHGINLTRATLTIWYAPTTASNRAEQANNRMTRPGQKHNTHIVELVSTEVERQVYQRQKTRQSMQGLLLSMLEHSGD